MTSISHADIQWAAAHMLKEWTPDKFTKRYMARDAQSRPIWELDSKAVRFCFIGMTGKLFDNTDLRYELRKTVEHIIQARPNEFKTTVVADVNDGPLGYRKLRGILKEIAENPGEK